MYRFSKSQFDIITHYFYCFVLFVTIKYSKNLNATYQDTLTSTVLKVPNIVIFKPLKVFILFLKNH